MYCLMNSFHWVLTVWNQHCLERKNGNTYLYSPAKKRILPIPEHLFVPNLNSYVEDRCGKYLFDNNYLDEYHET